MFSKAKPRKNSSSKGRREDGSEEEHRSRSGSPAGAGSKPATRSKKRNKKKMERDDSAVVKDRSYYLKDVQVVCEKLQQDVRKIKKEAEDEESKRSDAEQVEMEEEAVCSSDRPVLPKSPAGKRRREATPESVTDDDRLQEISKITEGLLALLTRDKGVPQLVVEEVRKHCKIYERVLQKQLLENARLEGKIAALTEVNCKVDAACTAVHAAVEKLESMQLSGTTGHETPAATKGFKRTYALVVKGDQEELTAADVLKKVNRTSRKIDKEDVKIHKIRHLQSDKGVVVVTQNAEDRAKIARVLNEQSGLKAVEPKEVNPQIVIYDVKEKKTEQDLLRGMARVLGEPDPQKIENKVKPLRRMKSRKEDRCNVIFDVAPEISKKLLNEGRIYCGWASYKVAQWEEVLQCFNCLEFGHIRSNCKAEQRCWDCSGTGHVAKSCKRDEHCINCKKKGEEDDHSATSRSECPTYQWQLQMLRARTRRD